MSKFLSKNGVEVILNEMIEGDIGCILEDGTIERGSSDNGLVFKSMENFKKKEGICYIPELTGDNVKSAEVFTYDEFLKLTGGNEEMATEVFRVVNWQDPSTYINADLEEAGYDYCEECGYLYFVGDDEHATNFCPNCKVEMVVEFKSNGELLVGYDSYEGKDELKATLELLTSEHGEGVLVYHQGEDITENIKRK